MKKLFHKGLSLIELVCSLALMGLVTAAAVSVLALGVHGFTATKQVIDVTMADTDFATRISTAIRNSGTSFTIPQNSFTKEKFTEGWNYLGLMPEIMIPKEVSRTGEKINSADALVYVEWYGKSEPDQASLSANQQVVHNVDGYFIMSILGHSYVDRAGVAHNYSLIFEPTDPDNHAAQSVKYTFGTIGDSDATIETVLESINAIQTVFQGDYGPHAVNPATAIAFRSDFLSSNYSSSTTAATEVYGTVVLVMDVSGSMTTNKLVDPMKSTAKQFLDQIAASNAHMNALLVTFGSYADRPSNFNITNPTLDVANIGQNLPALKNTIDNIKITGSTNLGDGLRVASVKLHNYESSLNRTITRTPDDTGNSVANPIHLVILSDGAMNMGTIKPSASSTSTSLSDSDFYTGTMIQGESGWSSAFKASKEYANHGRKYFSIIAPDFKTDFLPTVYVVNLFSGMKAADLNTIKAVFPDYQEFNADNFVEMEAVFTEIGNRINGQMWAFEGPKL